MSTNQLFLRGTDEALPRQSALASSVGAWSKHNATLDQNEFGTERACRPILLYKRII